MLKQELLKINGREFMRTYSDEKKYVIQVETGIEYSEAYDLLSVQYTYMESKKYIEV